MTISRKFCVDLSRLYVFGQSNGAMFTYDIISILSRYFAAATPNSGSPHPGHFIFSEQFGGDVSLLHIHGDNDPTIPFEGGFGSDNWKYSAGLPIVETYATLHGCEHHTAPMDIPFTSFTESSFSEKSSYYNFDGTFELQCHNFMNCAKGAVAYCTFNGTHQFPKKLAELSYWFLSQFRRDSIWEEKLLGDMPNLRLQSPVHCPAHKSNSSALVAFVSGVSFIRLSVR